MAKHPEFPTPGYHPNGTRVQTVNGVQGAIVRFSGLGEAFTAREAKEPTTSVLVRFEEDNFERWYKRESLTVVPIDDALTEEQQVYADIMFVQYRETLLWQSLNEAHFEDPDEPEMLDEVYSVEDFSDEANDSMRADVEDFVRSNWETLVAAQSERDEYYGASQAGHDFALTRNHHGAGFWDRGLGEVGDRLTANAHPYGSSSAYIGDDGCLYVN